MNNKRITARDVAVKMMYSLELRESTYADVVSNFEFREFDIDGATLEFAKELFRVACENREKDDEIISKFLSKNWTIERIGLVEKCILRTAISEFFHGTAPAYAILDDFVTIAKHYGDDKTASFINGILESIRSKFDINRGYDDDKLQDA